MVKVQYIVIDGYGTVVTEKLTHDTLAQLIKDLGSTKDVGATLKNYGV